MLKYKIVTAKCIITVEKIKNYVLSLNFNDTSSKSRGVWNALTWTQHAKS